MYVNARVFRCPTAWSDWRVAACGDGVHPTGRGPTVVGTPFHLELYVTCFSRHARVLHRGRVWIA